MIIIGVVVVLNGLVSDLPVALDEFVKLKTLRKQAINEYEIRIIIRQMFIDDRF